MEALKVYEMYKQKKIPDYVSNNLDQFSFNYESKTLIEIEDMIGIREKVISEVGFVLLHDKFITALSEYIGNKKCLEILAGCGSLSYALQQKGIDCIATDDYSWNKAIFKFDDSKFFWTDVEKLDCVSAIDKYNDIDFVICSWPSYEGEEATESLKIMRQLSNTYRRNIPMKMIYIGEGEGGCTANDEFHNIMNEIDLNETNKLNEVFSSWYAIHDRVFIVQ